MIVITENMYHLLIINGIRNSNNEITAIPNRLRHIMGTDNIGRDLSVWFNPWYKNIFIGGVVAMGIASIIGVFLGALAGFFGDRNLLMTRGKYYFTLVGIFLAFFYGFGVEKICYFKCFFGWFRRSYANDNQPFDNDCY